MPDFDLSTLPDLLARLDAEAASPIYSHDDPAERHECCVQSAAAIRTLMDHANDVITERDAALFALGCPAEDARGAAAEREACAKVRERKQSLVHLDPWQAGAYEASFLCAAAIRERGEK